MLSRRCLSCVGFSLYCVIDLLEAYQYPFWFCLVLLGPPTVPSADSKSQASEEEDEPKYRSFSEADMDFIRIHLPERAASVPIIISLAAEDHLQRTSSPPALNTRVLSLPLSPVSIRRAESTSLPSRLNPRLPSIPEMDESNAFLLEADVLSPTLGSLEPRKKGPVFLSALGRVSTRNRLKQEEEEDRKKTEEREQDQEEESSKSSPRTSSDDDRPSAQPRGFTFSPLEKTRLPVPKTSKEEGDDDATRRLSDEEDRERRAVLLRTIVRRASAARALVVAPSTVRSNGWIETDL